MKEKYKAAFIVPLGATKTLCEDGWEFESTKTISTEIKLYLVEKLGLCFVENYLGIDCCSNNDIKMSVVNNDLNQIESIHFQLYKNGKTMLSEVFNTAGEITNEVELFIP